MLHSGSCFVERDPQNCRSRFKRRNPLDGDGPVKPARLSAPRPPRPAGSGRLAALKRAGERRRHAPGVRTLRRSRTKNPTSQKKNTKNKMKRVPAELSSGTGSDSPFSPGGGGVGGAAAEAGMNFLSAGRAHDNISGAGREAPAVHFAGANRGRRGPPRRLLIPPPPSRRRGEGSDKKKGPRWRAARLPPPRRDNGRIRAPVTTSGEAAR